MFSDNPFPLQLRLVKSFEETSASADPKSVFHKDARHLSGDWIDAGIRKGTINHKGYVVVGPLKAALLVRAAKNTDGWKTVEHGDHPWGKVLPIAHGIAHVHDGTRPQVTLYAHRDPKTKTMRFALHSTQHAIKDMDE